MLADAPLHPEAVGDDALIGSEQVIEGLDLGVEVLDGRADRVEGESVDAGNGDRVVALVDPEEADPQACARDLVDHPVRESGVEDAVVVAADALGCLGRDGDMPHARGAGHEASLEHPQRRRRRVGGREDLGRRALRAGEAPETLDPAQPALLLGALGDRQPDIGDATEDDLEGLVVIDEPAESRDVLDGGALEQEAALVLVESEAHDVTGEFVDVQADRVGAEASPVHEALGADDDIPEVDRAKNIASTRPRGVGRKVSGRHTRWCVWCHSGRGGHRATPVRKSTARRLKSSGASHCTQCPTPAAR